MKINRQIRAQTVRLIGNDGKQVGIVSFEEALNNALDLGLDLVEISPNANPPVCKIIDYDKLRYDQIKKEKVSKKSQHQVKVKGIKFKPNIDQHDLGYKIDHAKTFLEKGNKVRVSCMFRGREILHTENGRHLINQICQELAEYGEPEFSPKMVGRNLSVTIAPLANKK